MLPFVAYTHAYRFFFRIIWPSLSNLRSSHGSSGVILLYIFDGAKRSRNAFLTDGWASDVALRGRGIRLYRLEVRGAQGLQARRLASRPPAGDDTSQNLTAGGCDSQHHTAPVSNNELSPRSSVEKHYHVLVDNTLTKSKTNPDTTNAYRNKTTAPFRTKQQQQCCIVRTTTNPAPIDMHTPRRQKPANKRQKNTVVPVSPPCLSPNILL